jgi:hypothetical protein
MVEGAVRVLARHAPDDDLRSCFARLYRFQEGYDTGFTHFRVMELLREHRFAYRFPLSAHPEHAGLDEFTFLHEDDDELAPIAGYVDPPWLYCDAGSDLWRRRVEAGQLTGADAEAPQAVPLLEVVLKVARAAEQDGDPELIAMWFNMGPQALLVDTFTREVRAGEALGIHPFTGEELVAPADGVLPREFSVEDLQALPQVSELRDIVRRTRAMEVELHYDHRPPPEYLAESPVDACWWDGL